ncbi:MAG: helix-turn-helix transcriptional regulator [Acidimicrobiales bacterium]|nr:helix-turn-helix transcriptional regulator [Acidimicrobiales bacterium]MBO0893925.1 helix-turn-helix transcriptional regulator [Acidimicrobiales bacterium]
MKSYGQYCAVAKALDIVGDRWTLLVVRELLMAPRRYRDLLDGLPGVATNLLADRLRHLEASGVVARDDEDRYVLTPWGERLAEPVTALARWASPLMAERAPDEVFRPHWMAGPVAVIFGGVDPYRPPLVVELRTEGSAVTMISEDGVVRIRPGPAESPDLVVSGPPEGIIRVLAGRLDKKQAAAEGVHVVGDLRPLGRLRRRDSPEGAGLAVR